MMHHCDIVYRIVALVSRYVSYREKLYHCSPYDDDDDVDDTFHYHVDQFFFLTPIVLYYFFFYPQSSI